MGNSFSGPRAETETVGAWPNIRRLQGPIVNQLRPIAQQLGDWLQPNISLWRDTAAGNFLNPMTDPNLQPALDAIRNPAMNWFDQQQRGLASKFINSGNTFSSKRYESQSQLALDQAQQLQNALAGLVLPLSQSRRGEMFAAAEMPLRMIDLLRSVGQAGQGTTQQVQYGPSPFSQLFDATLGLANTAGNLGWQPF